MTVKYMFYNSAVGLLHDLVYVCVLLVAAYKLYKNPAFGLGMFALMMPLSEQFQTVTIAPLVRHVHA